MNMLKFFGKTFVPKLNNLIKQYPRETAGVLVIFFGLVALGGLETQIIASNASAEIPVERQTLDLSTHEEPDERQAQENFMEKIVFAGDASPETINSILDKQIRLITSRPAFLPSLNVVKKYEGLIRKHAEDLGVPADVALGVAFLENGGSDSAKSVAGALGIFQLMPGTARGLGLTVNSSVDERLEPEKNIRAGLTYLANHYRNFGDWGLSVWAYHAGGGNVGKALKIFALHNRNEVLQPSDYKAYIKRHGLNIHALLSDAEVQRQLTSKLKDDSAGYTYKVAATANLYDLASKIGEENFHQRIAQLHQRSLSIDEFLKS